MAKGTIAALTPKQRAALRGFALDVLAILERDEDWSSNTLDAIGAASDRRGLNTLDRNGLFRVARPYRGRS